MNPAATSLVHPPLPLKRGDAMEYRAISGGAFPVQVHISRFQGQNGVSEVHLTAHPVIYERFDVQLNWLLGAYRQTCESLGMDPRTAVLRRFFCSDISNQARTLEAHPLSNPRNPDETCAISWVCQPPVPPARVALWAYHIHDPEGERETVRDGATAVMRRGDVAHYWTTGMTCLSGGTSHDQTRGIFRDYHDFLQKQGMALSENAIRTWLFVRNIDADYMGLVAARRDFFSRHGLTADTHYIASTGIEGAHAAHGARVSMDAYAISGILPRQIEYLAAPDHLSPTHVYGVTFERGTAVAWRDRRHVFISGTASIDHRGEILHPGNVLRQFDRTIENIGALLEQAGATIADMSLFIVYVRDPADAAKARDEMRLRFGDAPVVAVTAPVCRPGWLIEVEGQAIVPISDPSLPEF